MSKWISVRDRLPEDFVDVLTVDKKGNMHIFCNHHDFTYPFCIPANDTRYYQPTHWQPLPKPPKGGKQC